MIKILQKFASIGPFNNTSALVEIMAWCWTGKNPLLELMMKKFYKIIAPNELNSWTTSYLIVSIVSRHWVCVHDVVPIISTWGARVGSRVVLTAPVVAKFWDMDTFWEICIQWIPNIKPSDLESWISFRKHKNVLALWSFLMFLIQ